MTVVVNGEARELAAGLTIDDVVRSLTDQERGVAVALNGEVVPRGAWATTTLWGGEHIEVLRAVQGG
jgi:sulfur carrier protein